MLAPLCAFCFNMKTPGSVRAKRSGADGDDAVLDGSLTFTALRISAARAVILGCVAR